MADTTSVNLRVEKNLKHQAEELFSQLGLNMTTAINMFLKQSVREQRLPFQVTTGTYDRIPAYVSNANSYDTYDEYISDNLRQSEIKVAEGKMSYYTIDEIKAGLEAIIDETIQHKI